MISQLPGIYQIRNTTNGKTYVGSASSLRRRWCEHTSRLRRGAHDNRHLQRAWAKHGAETFAFEPLIICSKDMLVFYEQRALDVLKPEYNLAPTAGNTLGVKMSAEARAAMAAARSGKKQAPEVVARRAAANTGKKRSEETKAKMRVAQIGRKLSEEAKAKLRAANLGKTLTPETRAKISEGNTGKPCGPRGPLTEEHRRAISAALQGITRSLETRAKMSAARRARVKSGEVTR